MKSRAYRHASKPTKGTTNGTTNGTTVGRVLLTAALAMGLLAGCTKEKTNESGGAFTGETITVPVTLTPEFMGGVTVKSAGAGAGAGATGDATLSHSPGDLRSLMRVSAYTGPEAVAMAQAGTSAATRSQTGVDESLVSDVWFVQLNAAGTAALQPPVYLNSGELTGTQLPIELVTEPSMVYFLANSHNASLMNPAAALASFTKTTVEALSKTYAAASLESDLTTQGMPMAGRWEGTPSGSAIAVPLKRAVVKVTVNLSAELPMGHTFSPKFIQVCRVPSTLTLYRDAVAAPKPYPASSGAGAVAFTDYASEKISANLTTTPISFVYYLPENARGTGTGTTQQEKTAAKAPGAEGPFCTYVQIVGEYNNAARTELTKYTVFLGGDNTADYNLLRNNAYGVGITLKGGDPGLDVRITTLPITIESTETDKTKLTLTYAAGAKGPFTVSDMSGLQWTVTSADPTWLQIATTAAATDAAESQIGTGIQTYYAYAASENTGEPRSSEIVVSRFGPPDGRLAVTQKKKPLPATVKPLNLTIPAHANLGIAFYIDNKNSDLQWTVQSNDDWLKIADNENGTGYTSGFSGTGDMTLFAYATHLTPQPLSGTLTLRRGEMSTITLKVSQEAAVLRFGPITPIPYQGTGGSQVNASPGLKWNVLCVNQYNDINVSLAVGGPWEPELKGEGSRYLHMMKGRYAAQQGRVYLRSDKPGCGQVSVQVPILKP